MTAAGPRLTLARPDLAAADLEGIVPAARYEPVRAMRVGVPVAPVFSAPGPGAERVDELIFGERFDVLETAGGFAWGRASRDGYVGYVAVAALAPPGPPPTHRVAAIRADVFAGPTRQAAASGPLGLNALVAIEAGEGAFSRAAAGAWLRTADLAPIGSFERDPAAVAERFLGAPYLSGGRTGAGIDGSGLVQQALYACGRACPRDADQQLAAGREIARGEAGRGDLVGWRGHVVLLLDGSSLIHASQHQMAVAVEPLEEAIARIMADGRGTPLFRRL